MLLAVLPPKSETSNGQLMKPLWRFPLPLGQQQAHNPHPPVQVPVPDLMVPPPLVRYVPVAVPVLVPVPVPVFIPTPRCARPAQPVGTAWVSDFPYPLGQWQAMLDSEPGGPSLRTFHQILQQGTRDPVAFAFSTGLLEKAKYTSHECNCGADMQLKISPAGMTVWSCRICRTRRSLFKSAFGKCSHLPPCKLLHIILYWCLGRSIHDVVQDLGIAKPTICAYYAILRGRAAQHLKQEFQEQRFDHAVQIDESLFGKRKYNVGRKVRQDWVFGICDSTPGGRVYMERVEKRDALTLFPIVVSFVDFEALIASDEWAAYRQLNAYYFHTTVCHKANFVDPTTGTHTQRIESLWTACKHWLRVQGYRDPECRSAYISEWCWRCNHKHDWLQLWRLVLN
jgi:hypothetical protein